MVLKNCKACLNQHHGPWGTRCLFVKAAKAKCVELGTSEDDFRLHLDFSDMEKLDSGELSDPEDKDMPTGDQVIDPALIKNLVQINIDQRATIDLLVNRLDNLSINLAGHVQPGVPVSGAVYTPASGGGGVAMATTVAVSQPAIAPATTAVGGTTPLSQSPVTTSTAVGGSKATPTGQPKSPASQPSIPGIAGSGHSPGVSVGSHQHSYMQPSFNQSHGYPSLQQTFHPQPQVYSSFAQPQPVNPQATYSSWSHQAPVASAASLVKGPLTPSLSALSGDNSADLMSAGIHLRPEYHVQHVQGDTPVKNISHKSLSYYELMYGMCMVAQYLFLVGGDIYPYLSHMGFITRQARLDCYVDSTFIEYDRIVVDAVVKREIPTFVAGYPLAQSLCFHSANHKSNSNKGKGRWYQSKRSTGNKGNEGGRASEVCFNYNFKTCEGCERAHVCKICRGNHKSPSCPIKEKNTS